MRIPLHQVDAFADRPFTGNPAAICPLEQWLPDEVMQSIAAENNLSETAFLVRRPADAATTSTSTSTPTSTSAPGNAGAAVSYQLRWFTPAVEVDLCGHATLASAHVVLNRLDPAAEVVTFHTRSGELVVSQDDGGALRMDLPADPRTAAAPPPDLLRAIGCEPVEVLGGPTWIAVLVGTEDVVGLRPDLGLLAALDVPYLVVTAPGDTGGPHGTHARVLGGAGPHFVSRFFAPGAGIDEDPVTGSAHCALMPYWAERLGSNRLRARQVSARGGDLDCELLGDRVILRGTCVAVLEGMLSI